jgi:hypothetical protein
MPMAQSAVLGGNIGSEATQRAGGSQASGNGRAKDRWHSEDKFPGQDPAADGRHSPAIHAKLSSRLGAECIKVGAWKVLLAHVKQSGLNAPDFHDHEPECVLVQRLVRRNYVSR